jgi:hypothetical protein
MIWRASVGQAERALGHWHTEVPGAKEAYHKDQGKRAAPYTKNRAGTNRQQSM